MLWTNCLEPHHSKSPAELSQVLCGNVDDLGESSSSDNESQHTSTAVKVGTRSLHLPVYK